MFTSSNENMKFAVPLVNYVFLVQVIKAFIGSERTSDFTTIPVCVNALETVRCFTECTS